MKLPHEEVRCHLEALLAAPEWAQSVRMAQFLRFVVERSLAGEGAMLKESVVGVEVFRRDPGYDPKIDPVVRVEARRLRSKLQEYYAGSGAGDPIRIVLPKGTYQPAFERAPIVQSTEPVDHALAADPPAPLAAPPEQAPAATHSEGRKWRAPALFLAGAATVITVGVWLGSSRSTFRPPAPPGTPRLLTGRLGYSRSPAFSPDGDFVAFSRDVNANRSFLYVRPVSGGDSRPLTDGLVLDYEPVWSPDGRTIAFLRQQERDRFAIMTCSVSGARQERRIADVALRGPIDWTIDGRSIAAADRDDPSSPFAIFLIDLADGRKRQITSPPNGTPGDSMPRVSPDGKSIAFVRSAEASVQDVHVVGIGGGTVRRLSSENRVVEGLAWHPREPQVIASMQRGSELRSLWRIFVNERRLEHIPDGGIGPVSPALARKGDKLAYVERFSDTNVWRARLSGKSVTSHGAITAAIGLDTSPQLSPDGRFVAWRSTSSGTNEVWIARSDGGEPRQLTHMNGPTTGSPHWSPDANWIVFDSRPKGHGDIFLIPSQGGSQRALTDGTFNAVLPSFSHDGKWIYYSTDRAGMWEVWRMTVEGRDAKRVAALGAFNAVESGDGNWLYYTRRGGGESGIWRIPTGGGSEEKLTAELTANFWGQWAVSSQALFYAVFSPAGSGAIRRLDLGTRAIRDVFTLERMPVQFDSGMTVTRDERFVLWSQLDRAGSDVLVVDGFR